MPMQLATPKKLSANQDSLSHLKSTASDFQAINNELKQLDRNPDEYWYAMGTRLERLLRQRLYLEGGYHSFSDYCARGLGYSRQHAYKLIKITQFVDQLRSSANTDEELINVQRLIQLGFTKLYLLHTMPRTELNSLLKDGLALSPNLLGLTVPLEQATISQIKRRLTQPKSNQPPRNADIPVRTLVTVLKSQANSLNQLIEECQQDLDNSERMAERLVVLQEYAQSIVNGLDVLAGE